ncbi:hypothetical protein J4405_00010 [Candidatus Woesearchaeota archaeon]|nr:hypothetical protein [Candidatus Woesearchaeota archaeon]
MVSTLKNPENVALVEPSKRGYFTLNEIVSDSNPVSRVQWILDNFGQLEPVYTWNDGTIAHNGFSASVFFDDSGNPKVYDSLNKISPKSFATAWLIAHAAHILSLKGVNLETGEYTGNPNDLPYVRIDHQDLGRLGILKNLFGRREPLTLSGGRTSSLINSGLRFSKPSETYGNGLLKIQVRNVLDLESGENSKLNPETKQDEIEFILTEYLHRFPECNFVEALRLDKKGITTRKSNGESLFDKTYLNDDTRRIPKEITQLLQEYRLLGREAVNQMRRLNDPALPLSEDQRNYLKDLPIRKLSRRTGISIDQIAGNYQTYRLATDLNLDINDFNVLFGKIQTMLNTPEQDAVWQIDASSKNRKQNCFDGNKVEYAPIQRALVTLFEAVPFVHDSHSEDWGKSMHDIFVEYFSGNRRNGSYFTKEERTSLIEQTVNLWNPQMKIDDNFWRIYDAESLYRAALNMAHSLREAKSLYLGESGIIDETFSKYACLLAEVPGFMKLACESASDLVSKGAITEQEAKNLCLYLAESADKSMSYNNPSLQSANMMIYSRNAFETGDLPLPDFTKASPSLKRLVGIN